MLIKSIYFNMANFPPRYVVKQVLRADIDFFITAYGLSESIELTNKANPAATTVCAEVLQAALDDAECLINNYIEIAPLTGQAILASSFRRVQVVIARYYLDSIRRRPDVVKDYEEAIKLLQTQSGIEDQSKWRTVTPGSLIKWSNKRRPQWDQSSMDPYKRMESLFHSELRFVEKWNLFFEGNSGSGGLPGPEDIIFNPVTNSSTSTPGGELVTYCDDPSTTDFDESTLHQVENQTEIDQGYNHWFYDHKTEI